MGTEQNPKNTVKKKDLKDQLSQILDFGPEEEIPTNDFNQRVTRIVKKLKELSTRIDHLSSRF